MQTSGSYRIQYKKEVLSQIAIRLHMTISTVQTVQVQAIGLTKDQHLLQISHNS